MPGKRGSLFEFEEGGVEPQEDVILSKGGRPARAMTDQERYPGLVGPMPQKFTPAETAATLASLKANQRPYLQVNEDQNQPLSILRREDSGDGAGGLFISGGGQNRGEAQAERESIAAQIGRSEERDATLMAGQDRERAIDAERQKMAFAADKAARDQAFFEEYGIEPSPQAVAEVVKHNSAAAMSEGLAHDLDTYDQLEEQEMAQVGPGGEGRHGIQKKYENLRRLRMISYGFSSGVNPGTSLREPAPPKPRSAAESWQDSLMGGNGPTQ